MADRGGGQFEATSVFHVAGYPIPADANCHLTSNNTLQHPAVRWPETRRLSSNYLRRPVPIERFSMICARLKDIGSYRSPWSSSEDMLSGSPSHHAGLPHMRSRC